LRRISLDVELKKNLEEQKRLLDEVVTASDFRSQLVSAYQNHGGKKRLGKDMFIAFTSIMKEMWEHEHDMASYNNYVYIATNLYVNSEDIVNQEFNQFRDATLHGNVLRSDVFKFHPAIDPKVYVAAGYPDIPMPKPIELKIYSLNSIVSSLNSKKTGGAPTILGGYL
jgi:hypothetical protein